MHVAFAPFVKRFRVIDNLTASNKGVAMCKKELRMIRVVLDSQNWPSSDMVLKSRRKKPPISSEAWTQEKLSFFNTHVGKVKNKLESFRMIVAITDRRWCATTGTF
jgi:hypothetical protein